MINIRKILEDIDVRAFDHLHQDTKKLFGFPRLFNEGVHFSLSKPVGQALQLTHTVSLTSIAPATYAFTAAYKHPQNESGPVVTASMDSQGNLACAATLKTENNKIKMLGRTEGSSWMGAQVELQHCFRNSALTLKLTNINPLAASGITVVNYLHQITAAIALGGEVKCEFGEGQFYAIPSVGGRYRTDAFCLAARLSPRGVLEASCMRKISKKVSVATELDVNLLRREALAGLSCVYHFRDSTIYTQINSNGSVAAVIEKELAGPNIKFSLSGMIDHYNARSAFGMGFNVQM